MISPRVITHSFDACAPIQYIPMVRSINGLVCVASVFPHVQPTVQDCSLHFSYESNRLTGIDEPTEHKDRQQLLGLAPYSHMHGIFVCMFRWTRLPFSFSFEKSSRLTEEGNKHTNSGDHFSSSWNKPYSDRHAIAFCLLHQFFCLSFML